MNVKPVHRLCRPQGQQLWLKPLSRLSPPGDSVIAMRTLQNKWQLFETRSWVRFPASKTALSRRRHFD